MHLLSSLSSEKYVFREQEADGPAAAGKNAGSPKASKPEAALSGKVHESIVCKVLCVGECIVICDSQPVYRLKRRHHLLKARRIKLPVQLM